MDSLIYTKSLEGQKILINKNENGITGSWMKDGNWISDVDISSLHLENHPLILERLNYIENANLIIGFSNPAQLFYAMIAYSEDNNKLKPEQYVSGYDTTEILTVLNNRLISVNEYQELQR